MPPETPSPKPLDPRPLVLGLGNEQRGDDGAGPQVARLVRPRLGTAATVLELAQDGASLLDLWEGAGLVVVVDAMRSGRPPGTVDRIDVGDEPLASPARFTSTHGLSVADAVALGQALHRLPRRLVIYAVEGADFQLGGSLSPAVAAALDPLAGRIEAEVRQGSGASPAPHGR